MTLQACVATGRAEAHALWSWVTVKFLNYVTTPQHPRNAFHTPRTASRVTALSGMWLALCSSISINSSVVHGYHNHSSSCCCGYLGANDSRSIADPCGATVAVVHAPLMFPRSTCPSRSLQVGTYMPCHAMSWTGTFRRPLHACIHLHDIHECVSRARVDRACGELGLQLRAYRACTMVSGAKPTS